MKISKCSFVFLFLSCGSAWAQLTVGSACSTNGAVAFSSGNILVCNGTASQYALTETVNSSGYLGINQSSPQAALDVNGGARLGNDSSTCSNVTTNTGELSYSSNRLSYCNGTGWTTLGAAATPIVNCGQSGTFSGAQGQQITVAKGCTVLFKAWGGAGGGGNGSASFGGGGGYAMIILGPLGAATTYYLSVGGGGGITYPSCNTGCGWGGGGLANFMGGYGYAPSNGVGGGGGGGASGVWTGSYGGTPVIVAAGGGGGGSFVPASGTAGGTTIICGANSSSVGQPGSNSKAGGGGAGYPYGSVQGAASWGACGGENYAASGGATMTGGGVIPGGASDVNYPSGAGLGSGGNGADGAIYYQTY
jgi:hypothetical protein